jgi:uncharacterized protein involved in copper resistance
MKILLTFVFVAAIATLGVMNGTVQGEEGSKTEHPKAEHPKSEHPKADHPKSEHPKADHPKTGGSKSEHPQRHPK